MDQDRSIPGNGNTSSETRKQDHISLAEASQTSIDIIDKRFLYEPLLSGHPKQNSIPEIQLLGTSFKVPVWVSSMTGGTESASRINRNLAKACRKFGMGMGLGSCRPLLYSDDSLEDFNVRTLIGDRPLYANLGIAQVEEIVNERRFQAIKVLIDKLSADGLIIHVNPLQEWLQPEGDRYHQSPLTTIRRLLEKMDIRVIVKEVGQGMGPSSIKEILSLPIQALDFGAHGGTNFSKLELLRSQNEKTQQLEPLVNVGHSAFEMVEIVNAAVEDLGENLRCREIIVSGGIKNFLDGYYCLDRLSLPAIYGQASAFLNVALEGYEKLETYIEGQLKGLDMAYAFLKARKPL